ncbi:MAG: RHS repeat-associated core domain-containing protein, partial [Alicyclobacillus macrosporangiidus]|uniref:RHS repeat-associated core domain-containing protein n=1 Tax=Alicyclobacillus macrosporangiidus TaxID=392015 RepID=UPI0026ECF549
GLDTANPFIYRGYWYDWDTGLYYLNARYYNPKIGWFLSEDPVAPKVGDAESYIAYSYVRNNPQSFTDPSGEDWTWTDTALVAGTVVAGALTFGIGAAVVDVAALSLMEDAMTSVAADEAESTGLLRFDLQRFANGFRRSEHANLRAGQGRAGSIRQALNDVQKARPSDVLRQNDGRWVVKGSNGRVHIFEEDGEHVTSFRNSAANTAKRIAEGTWNLASEVEARHFLNMMR